MTEDGPYVYPGASVLRNGLGLTDPDQLDKVENRGTHNLPGECASIPDSDALIAIPAPAPAVLKDRPRVKPVAAASRRPVRAVLDQGDARRERSTRGLGRGVDRLTCSPSRVGSHLDSRLAMLQPRREIDELARRRRLIRLRGRLRAAA